MLLFLDIEGGSSRRGTAQSIKQLFTIFSEQIKFNL